MPFFSYALSPVFIHIYGSGGVSKSATAAIVQKQVSKKGLY